MCNASVNEVKLVPRRNLFYVHNQQHPIDISLDSASGDVIIYTIKWTIRHLDSPVRPADCCQSDVI
jgi:hypothetical protein